MVVSHAILLPCCRALFPLMDYDGRGSPRSLRNHMLQSRLIVGYVERAGMGSWVLLQMEGPSPLLPAWLDFWLQPSRAAWNRGLKSGASPLLLPPQDTASDQEMLPEGTRYPVSAPLYSSPPKSPSSDAV